MKKYLILLVAIFAFQTNINAKEKIDCSMHLKWSIQYMSCKAGALTISVKEGVKNTSKSILPEKFETNKIKIPYWVKQEDEIFWRNTDEINRCAYYYKRVSEEALENAGSSIIINYEEFIEKPNEIFRDVVKFLGLEFGEKTEEILSTVKYQFKHREDYLEGLDGELLSAIENLDEKLKASSFYIKSALS